MSPLSTTAPSPPELLLEEAAPAHARWSELNREFLGHVARNPEYLSRDTFASLYEARWLRKLPIQPWPLFAGAEQRREAERVALGMDRLIKGALERFLENDLARVMEFYHSGESADGWESLLLDEDMLTIILEEPNGIRSAPSRGDYIEDGDGLKCIEYNAGGFLGGLQTGALGDLYLECPPVARFLREQERGARAPDTLGALFRHLVDETARMGVWGGGDFNVAVVSRPHEEAQVALQSGEMYNRALRAVVAERGIPGGKVFACGPEDLAGDRGVLAVEGHPIHVVIEHHDGSVELREPFRLFKTGRLNFISGPINFILCDKRNLALISENARSDEFTSAERALIEGHLPWTRRVLPGQATPFRGRTLRLPDDLPQHREDMVLKKATSLGGRHVRVGKFRTEAEWRADLVQAVQEGDWIVQEYLETVPYVFQSGEHGALRHDMVWGLFAFGEHYGGAFLRMQPRGGGTGVVNTHQGAQVGVLLELTR